MNLIKEGLIYTVCILAVCVLFWLAIIFYPFTLGKSWKWLNRLVG